MTLLAEIEQRFEASYEGGGFDRAFQRWRDENQAVEVFPDLDSLIGYCRDGGGADLDMRDEVVAYLCLKAADRDERAALLILWLHLPGLWAAIDDLNPGREMDPEDFDAELLTGFWQAARGAQRAGGISARLVIRAYWTAWEALQGSKQHLARHEDVPIEPRCVDVGEASDAIWDAQEAGVITNTEAWLVDVVRLVGVSDEEIANEFGMTRNAVKKRRLRAEGRLTAWIRDEELPSRRNSDGRGPREQKSGSCVDAGSSIAGDSNGSCPTKGGTARAPFGKPVQTEAR